MRFLPEREKVFIALSICQSVNRFFQLVEKKKKKKKEALV